MLLIFWKPKEWRASYRVASRHIATCRVEEFTALFFAFLIPEMEPMHSFEMTVTTAFSSWCDKLSQKARVFSSIIVRTSNMTRKRNKENSTSLMVSALCELRRYGFYYIHLWKFLYFWLHARSIPLWAKVPATTLLLYAHSRPSQSQNHSYVHKLCYNLVLTLVVTTLCAY